MKLNQTLQLFQNTTKIQIKQTRVYQNKRLMHPLFFLMSEVSIYFRQLFLRISPKYFALTVRNLT